MFADTILARFSDFLELVNVAELGVLEVPLAVSIFEVLVRVRDFADWSLEVVLGFLLVDLS